MRTLITLLTLTLTILSTDFARASTLVSDDLWLRQSVPGAENGAGFGTLRNISDEDIVIVAAYSNAASDVELHRHIHRDGQMSMEQIEALSVPAGDAVTLQPGGYHLMLMELHQPLEPGNEYQLTLRLSNGERVEFKVSVKPLLN